MSSQDLYDSLWAGEVWPWNGAYMGGGIGYGAQARQAALGNMYDIYGARQAGEGAVPGTFLNWLNTRMQG